MKFRVKPCIGALFSATALAMGAASSTHAAVYAGVWDPVFGSPFSNLGWRATAELFVPDSCVQAVGTGRLKLQYSPYTFGGTDNCGASLVRDTRVELYKADDPLKTAFDFVNIGNYTALTGVDEYGYAYFLDQQHIEFIDFVDGQVVGFETSISAGYSPDGTPTAFGGKPTLNALGNCTDGGPPDPSCYYDFKFNLKLTLQTDPDTGQQSAGGSRLGAFIPNGPGYVSSTPPGVTFKNIPEPGTLLLALGALGALGAAGRHRRR